ncbi:hypothetical protein KP509_07G073100 [Ceratopteris richardii]|uniref:Uncharacterized protein n=1 Tax=Ceratopteris richardii TaxID=49495 RepID=A0A8T2UMK3_CERRI|nr:hypothetical protein KP509_07G073100 [Ceratopteris richardii]
MRKRRPEGRGMEDVEISLHTSFCAAANSVSHLYTQAQNQNKIAFQAGQRYALEKLWDWMQKHQQQYGISPSSVDISNYVKMEMESLSQMEMSILQVQNHVVHSQQQMACSNVFNRHSG